MTTQILGDRCVVSNEQWNVFHLRMEYHSILTKSTFERYRYLTLGYLRVRECFLLLEFVAFTRECEIYSYGVKLTRNYSSSCRVSITNSDDNETEWILFHREWCRFLLIAIFPFPTAHITQISIILEPSVIKKKSVLTRQVVFRQHLSSFPNRNHHD